MDEVRPTLVLAFRAAALGLAAVSLALVVLDLTTLAIVTLAVGLLTLTLASLSVNRVETPAFRQAVFNTTLGFRSGQATRRRR